MVALHRPIRLALLVGVIFAVCYFFWLVRGGLYPFIIALFLAYLLNPAVCWLERKGMKRVWAIVLLYVFLFCVIVICGSQFVPVVIREMDAFAKELPSLLAKTDGLFQLAQSQYQNAALPYSLRLAFDQGIAQLELLVQETVSGMVKAILSIVSHGIGIIISPILAFYLLFDWYEIKKRFYLAVPGVWRPGVRLFLKDTDKVLNGVIRGQVTIAIIVGILVSIGLSLLHVKFAILIGMLAGTLDVIPYFGAFIGAAPAVLIALIDSPLLAGKVIFLFFTIHQLEGMIIGPRILGEQVGLHPVTVIFFLLVGGEIGGLAGLLLGVPFAALGKVLLRHLLKVFI